LIVNNAFTTTPDGTSTYIVGPNIIIRGDSGVTIGNRALAYASNTQGGQVRTISIINPGFHYSTANVTIANSGVSPSYGLGATAEPVISPPGGHGSDAVGELFGHNIMISVSIGQLEDESYPGNNDFRMIGLVRDPLNRANTDVATTSIVDGSFKLTVEAASGNFLADEIVTGTTTGTTGHVLFFANTNTTHTKGDLRLTRITTDGIGRKFEVGETITGANTGVSAYITAITPSPIREYTGDIIYIDNRVALARDPVQTENMKLLIKY
jgi:hypothetical protein